MLRQVLSDKGEQGFETHGLEEKLDGIPASFDALVVFGEELANLRYRSDWPYVEPSDFEGIVKESPGLQVGKARRIPADEASGKAKTAFVASVCGCQLGKPVEVNASLAELRAALEALNEWPLNDYFPAAIKDHLRDIAGCWTETTRENIRFAAPDDDLNYSILGMLALERHGRRFTRGQLARLWAENLPCLFTYGPERTTLAKIAMRSVNDESDLFDESWPLTINPGDELCGAMIRADAYGYACPGDPAAAAELAWKDAGMTHVKTGIYGAMFAAAAIAEAFVERNRLSIFRTALTMVPQNSRFYAIASDCIELVENSKDWLEGYEKVHQRYGEYGFCRIYQETGTLINAVRFAESVGHGICLQVMQGNDTDSYGCTAGSILGAYFGPEGLEDRWIEPFRDEIRTRLAAFYERSLSGVAARMGKLHIL